jgi:hypothetical protein
MPEQTLALKLNGAEIRKVLLEKIDQALSRDWSMNPATSYDFFEGKITVSISLHDSGREYPLDVSVVMQQGLEPAEAETQTVEIPINKLPPNVVRVDNGIEVPVLAKSGEGPATVKGIRYKKGSAPRSA